MRHNQTVAGYIDGVDGSLAGFERAHLASELHEQRKAVGDAPRELGGIAAAERERRLGKGLERLADALGCAAATQTTAVARTPSNHR